MNIPAHLSKSYDEELHRLTSEIARMGELALAQLDAAIDAVEHHDLDAAQTVIDNDDLIDTLELTINQDVVRLLALRAPMAGDLREVFSAVRIASDIERIGDYAGNIAKRVKSLSQSDPVAAARGLRRLSELAADLVREVLGAYQKRDAERARTVWKADDKLDAAYTSFFRELLTYMIKDPRSISAGTHLLFIAKHIERIGDHATNIAENVWYVVHGTPMGKDRHQTEGAGSP